MFNDKLKDAGFLYYDHVKKIFYPNKYVKVKLDGVTTIYKIRYNRPTNELFLSPLNGLDYNETSEWSARDDNTKYRTIGYYDAVIDSYLQQVNDVALGDAIYDFNTKHSAKMGQYEAPVSIVDCCHNNSLLL